MAWVQQTRWYKRFPVGTAGTRWLSTGWWRCRRCPLRTAAPPMPQHRTTPQARMAGSLSRSMPAGSCRPRIGRTRHYLVRSQCFRVHKYSAPSRPLRMPTPEDTRGTILSLPRPGTAPPDTASTLRSQAPRSCPPRIALVAPSRSGSWSPQGTACSQSRRRGWRRGWRNLVRLARHKRRCRFLRLHALALRTPVFPEGRAEGAAHVGWKRTNIDFVEERLV